MDTIFEMLTHRGEHLVGRAFGPLIFRTTRQGLAVWTRP